MEPPNDISEPSGPPPIERSSTPPAPPPRPPSSQGLLPPISLRPEFPTMSTDSFLMGTTVGNSARQFPAAGASSELELSRDTHPFHVSYQVAAPENLPVSSRPPTASAVWRSPDQKAGMSFPPNPLSLNRIQPAEEPPEGAALALPAGALSPLSPGARYACDPRLSEVRLEGRPRPGRESSFGAESLGPTGAPSPNGASAFCLHVRLLKERMELEVAMRREGLRCFVFVLFCVCLCVALSIVTATQLRNASQYAINEGLELGGLEEVVLPSDVYGYVSQLGHNSRRFFPLSSVYVEDPLAVTLLQAKRDFPSGPLMVPADAQPVLRMEWSMTAWIGFASINPLERPEKALIVRKALPDDNSGLSCWAWYTKGTDGFVLEYGRHNLDEGYAEIELKFPKQQNPSEEEMRLAALVVNTTHVTVALQSETEVLVQAMPLDMGNPTDCAGKVMEMGDQDLLLADVKFLPYQLSMQDFKEIVEVGSTLADIATGVEDSPARELEEPEEDATSALEITIAEMQTSLTKVLGDLVQGRTESLSDAIDGVCGVPVTAPEIDPSIPGAGTDFVSIVGAVPESLIARAANGDASLNTLNLTGAFAGLAPSNSGASFFTLTWWAKAGNAILGMRELSFLIPGGDGLPRFQLYFEDNSAFDGVPGWKFQFYNSPFCFDVGTGRAYANQCKVSPSWWCEAPSESGFGGTYDNIWRNFAVRFRRTGPNALGYALELFLDGKILCGATFEADDAFVPQGSTTNGGVSEVLFGMAESDDTVEHLGSEAEFRVRDMRLYDTALDNSHISQIGLAEGDSDCLDLSTRRDNAEYRTSLGLSCSRISALLEGDEPFAPIACDTEESIRKNCPVSCLPVANPTCWDGLPPQHFGALPEAIPPADTEYSYPRRKMASIYPPRSAAAKETMLQALEWSDDTSGTWSTILDSVQLLEAYDIVMSVDANPQNLGGIFLQNLGGDAIKNWWSSVDCSVGSDVVCPGQADPGNDNDAPNPLELKLCNVRNTICLAEKQLRTSIAIEQRDGVDDFLSSLRSRIGSQPRFESGLLSAGSSYTLWYWASAADVSDGVSPSITGIDGAGQICFSILGNQAIIPARSDADPEVENIILSLNDATLESDNWAFFALVYSADEGYAFSIDDSIVQVPLSNNGDSADGTPSAAIWRPTHGCDSLQYVINTGVVTRLSPIRVARRPAPSGSLQRLRLQNQKQYRTTITGPERSEEEMLATDPRPRASFPMKVYALTPPLAVQNRLANNQTELECESETAQSLQSALRSQRKRQCMDPYDCDTSLVYIPCTSQGGQPPTTFMGTVPSSNGAFFEFLWTLQNPVLVRNGSEFVPAVQYVDGMTQDLSFIFIFFAPDTRVATVTNVTFDMTTARMDSGYSHKQLKMFAGRERAMYLGWAITGAVLVLINAVLAVPAAVQECKSLAAWVRNSWGPVRRRPHKPRPRYTADTSQPDLFDLVLCLGLVVYMVVFISTTIYLDNKAPAAFAELAEIDWADSTSFSEKVTTYLNLQRQVISYTQDSNMLVDAAFWILILCAFRLILYLKIHPLIAGVTRTFEVCFWELVNFLVSFFIIYSFLAFIGHVRFGGDFDEFATMQSSYITLFSILIGDDAPDYGPDEILLTIYVISFIFICTLALLNFFLAIVVAGYDNVREAALENQVVTSFVSDALCVIRDYCWIWPTNGWPNKTSILNALWHRFPVVFENEGLESQVAVAQDEFVAIIMSTSRRTTPESAAKLFRHYFRFRFLHASKQWDLDGLPPVQEGTAS